jgi:hypothetical protein
MGVAIPVGRLQVATPETMAAAVNQPTVARNAVDARVRGVAADIIATDETVKDAAAAAVTADIAGRDLVESGDPRLLEEGDPDAFRVRDRSGRVGFEVGTSGDIRHNGIIERGGGGYLRWMDRPGGRVAMEIRPNGEVFIANLIGGGSGSGGTTVKSVRILGGAGQSNMEGADALLDPRLDATHSRLWEYGADTQKLALCTGVMDTYGTNTGMHSLLSEIGRECTRTTGPDEIVLLVNGAQSGSSLVGENAVGVWDPAYAGSNPRLFTAFLAQLDQAIAAAQTQWPGAEILLDSIFWHQGESDKSESLTAQAIYAERWDAFAVAIRAHFGDQALPIIIGGTNPERDATPDAAGAANITAAHRDTPRRVLRTAYALGVHNSTSNTPTSATEVVHYQREGLVVLAARMWEARTRAIANKLGGRCLPPRLVTAHRVGTQVTFEWSYPWCRVESFVLETSPDKVTWTPVPLAEPLLTTRTVTSAAAIWARISTVNDVQTSDPSAPIGA